MKSKRTGRDLPFIKIKCDNPEQAEALISGGLICQKTGIIFKVEEFRITPSIQQCFMCQSFGSKAPNCKLKNRNVLCVVKLIRTKTVQTKRKEPQNVQTVEDLTSPTTEAAAYKDQTFRQHVVHKQVSYASILKQSSPPPPRTHLILPPNKLYPWSQTWSFKSLSHNCVPRSCLKSKYRQNPICQNRSPNMLRSQY